MGSRIQFEVPFLAAMHLNAITVLVSCPYVRIVAPTVLN